MKTFLMLLLFCTPAFGAAQITATKWSRSFLLSINPADARNRLELTNLNGPYVLSTNGSGTNTTLSKGIISDYLTFGSGIYFTNTAEALKWTLTRTGTNAIATLGQVSNIVAAATNGFSTRTNMAQFDVVRTNWVIGQRYTNTVSGGFDSRRAFVYGTIACTAAVAGAGQSSLFVEHGTTYTNKVTVSAFGVVSLVSKELLTLPISPGDYFYFTDESSGGGSVAFDAGTGSWVGD